MGNFYRDNKDIENVIDLLDLSEVATLLEEDFKFAKEYDFAPKDAADAIDNYKRAIDLCGDIMANRIAPLAEETDLVGNTLNEDGSVTRAPGMKLAIELFGKTGLMGVTIPYYLGGLNMPCTVLTACNDIVSRGDAGLMNLFGLQGIAETINWFADEEIKKEYVPRLVTGEWTFRISRQGRRLARQRREALHHERLRRGPSRPRPHRARVQRRTWPQLPSRREGPVGQSAPS